VVREIAPKLRLASEDKEKRTSDLHTTNITERWKLTKKNNLTLINSYYHNRKKQLSFLRRGKRGTKRKVRTLTPETGGPKRTVALLSQLLPKIRNCWKMGEVFVSK